MKLSKTLLNTTAIMLLGTSVVYADSMNTTWDLDADGKIEALPETGTVSLTGTVSSINGDNKFTIKDATGETIDVNTKEKFSFKEGARVKVSGQIGDEALNMGDEITGASVSVLSATTANVKATGNKMAKTDKVAADVEANADVNADSKVGLQVGESEGVGVGVSASVTRENPVELKGEAKAKSATARRDLNKGEVASYDLDVDADVDNAETNAAVDGDLTADKKALANIGEESTIDKLPKQGRVTLTGTVDDIDGDKKFTLRDSAGETIDVNTATNLTVTKGEHVKVMGQVKSEFAGMGREIQATDVMSVR